MFPDTIFSVKKRFVRQQWFINNGNFHDNYTMYVIYIQNFNYKFKLDRPSPVRT